MGNRKTNADETGNKHSPNRQLEVPLFLLTQSKEDAKKWQLPQSLVKPGETLRQVSSYQTSQHFIAARNTIILF